MIYPIMNWILMTKKNSTNFKKNKLMEIIELEK